MRLKTFFRAAAKCLALAFLNIAGLATSFGQSTGGIRGSISDSSGASIPGVTVTVSNAQSGFERSAVTNQSGEYVFSSLQPATYDINVGHAGFKKAIKHASVDVGRDVTVDFALEVGNAAEAVEVSADVSTINLVDSKVDAIVAQNEMTELPLNGRSAFEMAKLVPGVVVTSVGSRNTDIAISITGRAATGTRISIDGITATDIFGGGGTGMNLSQDVVQEFQVSLNNNDPSVGISSSGAVNIITRSGSNDYHGTFFGYFRDGPYAAFPGLARPTPIPNPNDDPTIAASNSEQNNPPFWRRQYGGVLSGPLVKNRLFWLASIDDTRMVSSVSYNTGSSDLTAFNSLQSYPRARLLQDYRLDWNATDKHRFFARFSRDGANTTASGLSSQPSSFPSWDTIRNNHVYALVAGWTAVWSPSLVGEVRFGFYRFNIAQDYVPLAVQEAQQFAPQLPRMGDVTISGTNMEFGANNTTINNSLIITPQTSSNFTYLHGKHTVRFGGTYEPVRNWNYWAYDNPFTVTAFNPTQARQAGISVPSTFTTIGDLLQLPLASLTFGVGSETTFPFQGPGNSILWNPQVYAYVGDSYKVSPRLTVNVSLGYDYDALTAPDRDLPRPSVLSPILTGGVNAPGPKTLRFAPAIGVAWDPWGTGKTVFRVGSGVYYGTLGSGVAARERSQLLPLGDGYVSVPGSFVTNPITGKGTLSFSSATANASAGVFRLSDLINYIGAIRQQLQQTIFTETNQNFSQANIGYFKGNTQPIYVGQFESPISYQTSFGAQHQFGDDWLLDGSVLYDVTNHTLFTWDANRQFRPASLGGPAIPGFGQILVDESGGSARYHGLLVSLRKRATRRYSLSASYTLSSLKDTAATLVDYNVRANNWGYDPANPRQILTIEGTLSLPWGLKVAMISYAQSKLPFNPILSGIDLNGDGTANDRLPGLPLNGVGYSVSIAQLRTLVSRFNQTYAGTRDARGTLIQPVNLPANFATGDGILTQDVRISKEIKIRERLGINLMAEAFNLFNISNVAFPSSASNLYSSGFGQPTTRLGDLFGSGGPRAFEFVGRVTF